MGTEGPTRRELVLKGLAAAVALGVVIPEPAEAARKEKLHGRRWQDGYAVLGLAISDSKFLEDLLKDPRLALRKAKLRPTREQFQKIVSVKADVFRKVAGAWGEVSQPVRTMISGW